MNNEIRKVKAHISAHKNLVAGQEYLENEMLRMPKLGDRYDGFLICIGYEALRPISIMDKESDHPEACIDVEFEIILFQDIQELLKLKVTEAQVFFIRPRFKSDWEWEAEMNINK